MEDDAGATAKPAIEHPQGDSGGLDMEPAHALTFLAITLNHADTNRKGGPPDADTRETELRTLLQAEGKQAPAVVEVAPAKDGRARRVLLALWAISEVWRLAEEDPDEAQDLLSRIVGREGLVDRWLEGDDNRPGLATQIEDVSSDIVNALRQRFSSQLNGHAGRPFDAARTGEAMHPLQRASRGHPAKSAPDPVRTASKHPHFRVETGVTTISPPLPATTHLCLICLAESQLRRTAQEEVKGSGDLPPLISSPATTGLFGGLAYQHEGAESSMGLNDLNRLDVKKRTVYEGLDCQTRRMRLARLETLPNKDKELVVMLRMTLTATRRVGRPIHIFRGSPRRDPGIFSL